MPAVGTAYATRDELKKFLTLQTSDTSHDDELDAALAAASETIEQYCNRQFNRDEMATPRLFKTVKGTSLLIDDCWEAPTSVKVGTLGGTFGQDWTYGTQYSLEPENGILDGRPWPFYRIDHNFRCGAYQDGEWWSNERVQVTAKWGWAEIPAPVNRACLVLAAEYYKLGSAPLGVAGFNQGLGTIRVQQNSKATALLCPYVRRKVLVG